MRRSVKSPSSVCRTFVLAGLLILYVSIVRAQDFTDHLVQPPTLAPPETGSITGTLASLAFGSSDLMRGSFSLPGPFEAPTGRAPLLAQIFPNYAPENGLSEWGMGWRSPLTIRRHRLTGSLDYETDGFSGPWGRLSQGDDGNWYPLNLNSRAVHQWMDESWNILLPDGTRYVFSEAERTPRGIFAWHLTEVVSVVGDRTSLIYQESGGRKYLDRVVYGSKASPESYEIRISYEDVATPIVSYESDAPKTLSQRVDKVKVYVFIHGEKKLRWIQDLSYEDAKTGPAFYLTSVTRQFASGAIEPAVTYTYYRSAEHLRELHFQDAALLEEVRLEFGEDGFQPSQSAFIDRHSDGVTELEDAKTLRLASFVGGSWLVEPSPTDTGQKHRLCPLGRNDARGPRTFAYMLDGNMDPQVVAMRLVWNAGPKTEMVLCQRDGRKLSQTLIGAHLGRLGPLRRLTDLDRDFRADYVAVGSGTVSMLPNTSDEVNLGFGERVDQFLLINGQKAPMPEIAWFRDLNGDLNVDLIARYENEIVIWFGLGGFTFNPEGTRLDLIRADGQPFLGLADKGVYFVDANRDSLQDLLITSRGQATLLTNHASEFRELPVPALAEMDMSLARPVLLDVSGRGNIELLFAEGDLARYAALSTASTGLLKSVDDGRGNKFTLSYKRMDAVRGARARSTVLDYIVRTTAGEAGYTQSFSYHDAAIHGSGGFLVGFRSVESVLGRRLERSLFHIDEAIPGLLKQMEIVDLEQAAPSRIETLSHERREYEGVPWLRPIGRTEGWQDDQSGNSSWISEVVEEYASEFCPRKVVKETEFGVLHRSTQYADPERLRSALHCLVERETLTGVHDELDLNFQHEQEVLRNDLGQPETYVQHGANTNRISQHIQYDEFNRPWRIGTPGRGQTTIEYEQATGLMNAVIAPDGIRTIVQARDPLTEVLHQIDTERSNVNYEQHFRYARSIHRMRLRDGFGRGRPVVEAQSMVVQGLLIGAMHVWGASMACETARLRSMRSIGPRRTGPPGPAGVVGAAEVQSVLVRDRPSASCRSAARARPRRARRCRRARASFGARRG